MTEDSTGSEAPERAIHDVQHAHELERLTSFARGLALSSDPRSLADEILKWTQAFIPGAVGRLWSLSDDGKTRTLVASIGLRAARNERALRPSEGLGGRSVVSRETKVSLDVLQDPRFVKKDWARSEGLVSSIMLPLTHRDRVYGNLSVFTRTKHPFSEEEIRLLEAFAAQAAAALASAALYRDSLAKTEQLESLNRISASLASTLDGGDTLQLIVEEAPKLLRLDGAGLRLLEDGQLVVARQHPWLDGVRVKPKLQIGESLSGRVAREKRLIIIESIDTAGDIIAEHKDALAADGVRCWIGVPIMKQERLLGVLVAMGRQSRNFTHDDKALLSAFADHAAIAIENNRLYGALRAELAEREKVEAALRQHQDRLEELVEQRTASLRETQEQLVRKERLAALGQLTASVSHELRTPLGTIQTSLHTLEKIMARGELPPQPILDRATRNIARCDRIIADLMDYTGTSKINCTLVAAGPWLDGVLDDQSLPGSVSLSRQLDTDAIVAIDEDRFRRVIINLVENARQAFSGAAVKGADRPLVCVRCREEPQQVIIEVEDNGPGIAPEVMPRIFEPLFSTKGFGMGLGLSIVRQILEQHGGDIQVHSLPGRGTRVELHLPPAETSARISS